MNENLKRKLIFARVEEGVVRSVSRFMNQSYIMVECENQNVHGKDIPVQSLTQCIPINIWGNDGNGSSEDYNDPKPGTRCLVIFKDPEVFTHGYYVGAIGDPWKNVSMDRSAPPSPGSKKISTPTGSALFLDASSPYSSLMAGKSGVLVKEGHVELVTGDGSELGINGKMIWGRNSDGSAAFALKGDSPSQISTRGPLSFITEARMNTKGSSKVEDFSSGIYRRKAKLFEDSSQARQIVSGYFKYRGIDASAFGADAGDPTWDVSVLKGAISHTTAFGNILNQSLDPTGKVWSFVGPAEAPLSQVQLTSDLAMTRIVPAGKISAEVGGGTAGPLNSTINLDASNINAVLSPAGVVAAKLNMSSSSFVVGMFPGGTATSTIDMASSGAITAEAKQSWTLKTGAAGIVKMTADDTQFKFETTQVTVTIKGSEVEIDVGTGNKVKINGDVKVTGKITATKNIESDQEVVANASGTPTNLSKHKHPTAIPGPPSPPTPGT